MRLVLIKLYLYSRNENLIMTLRQKRKYDSPFHHKRYFANKRESFDNITTL